jgi:hypothetical protein
LIILAAVTVAAVLLVLRLFWPSRPASTDADDPWAQHNDSRMPSLEKLPTAGDTSVDAAIAAQINGVD